MVLKSCRIKFQKMKMSGNVGVRIKKKRYIEEYKKAVKTNRIKHKRLVYFGAYLMTTTYTIKVCPFCNSPNITKNTKKRNYRCENCQRSFPTNQVAVKKTRNTGKA
jgi:hypothetical protein